ncbi:protein mono-ADP-ribosyltransferase PARP14-like isoform X2 [Colossoma macropomum]|uniref:protein mono-ADP-ribosyltransferase PARP14-like isoform X2 n=1 Tax=Colossoma macropomum TaxID=42526 RepID=UPI001863C0A4|nr:protein mono-ADP-ribosyltransferase PARP14-like isoform X2 [Colossoma macropomum]
MEDFPHPLTVEARWPSTSNKTLTAKLQIYFQSKKKSQGGDCVVRFPEESSAATVLFRSAETRDQVLAKGDHSITIENQTVKLKVFKPGDEEKQKTEEPSAAAATGSDVEPTFQKTAVQRILERTDHSICRVPVSVYPYFDTDESQADRSTEPSPRDSLGDSPQSGAVVLEKLPDNFSKDILALLVENISDASEEDYSLEIIRESNAAVVTFTDPSVAEKFLVESRSNKKVQQYGLMGRALEKSRSVKVENLPGQTSTDLLELYFEKWGGAVKNITTVPEEQAAIVTFCKQQDAEKVLGKDLSIGKTAVTVYPYYMSLGTALYGKDRPTWTLPKPFTETIHPAIREFLHKKGLISSICKQMNSLFCQVNIDKAEVQLSPLPTLLKQKGITKRHIDNWTQNATDGFREILSNYAVFECAVIPSVWSTIETDIRSVVKDKAIMKINNGILTLAGMAQDINLLKPILENHLKRASDQMERDQKSVVESMEMSPAMVSLLLQEGLQHNAAAKYPELKLIYKKDTNQLALCGLSMEIVDIKNWILERRLRLKQKPLKMNPSLLEFLRSVDCEEMSGDLFTSKGISAVYTVENGDVVLTGSSDRALTEAEQRLQMALTSNILSLEDLSVLEKPEWRSLNDQLCDTYNLARKKTVVIKPSKHNDTLVVTGFQQPVLEVSRSLEKFINTHSRIEEVIRVKSCAVVKFINEKKSPVWKKLVKSDEVTVHFDPKRPLIRLSGERVHIQPAIENFQKIADALHTDRLTIKKAGAKKYFQEQGSMFLMMMKEHRFVVILEESHMLEEDEDDYDDDDRVEDFGQLTCEVQIPGGVIITVRKADICQFKVDAVVNAANEDLKHIGGVALALLKAAGPSLQESSDRYVVARGRVPPGKAVTTGAGRLPCKCVVHAVGPRYTDTDKSTAVKRLRQAVRESLNQAESNKCSSIAVPAISSGIFGFPLELCTETIAKELHAYVEDQKRQGGMNMLRQIHLVDLNANTVNAMAQAVRKEFAAFSPKMTFPQQMSSRGSGRGRGRGRGNRSQKYRRQGRQGQGYHGQNIPGNGQWGPGPRSNEPQGYRRNESVEFDAQGQPWEQNSSQPTRSQYDDFNRSGSLETQSTQEGLRIILKQGNIQDALSDVIVNTISEDVDLSKGAVSKALLQAAGSQLQAEARSNLAASGSSNLRYGDMVVTSGYNLNCQSVFHTVCPFWKGGAGSEDEMLQQIIRECLKKAEHQKMASISFPAIGTGNLGFPKDLVSSILLREIHGFSAKVRPQYLKAVTVIVHPSDNETVQSFIKSFRGGRPGPITKGAHAIPQQSPKKSPVAKPSQSPGLFGVVSTPTLGVHSVQVGHVTLEVSSGDITKERSDAIVNSSNQSFSLKAGVSKAILDAAGLAVELECAQIVNAPSFQQKEMILTSGGQLPCKHIIHVVGRNTPAAIKDAVYSVLKLCEAQKFSSVAFPALGTGQGGASPSAVADAMIDAVIDFVKKKKGSHLQSVKFLIFQTSMVSDFHKSMLRRQQEGVEEDTGVLGWVKDKIDSVASYFMGNSPEASRPFRSEHEDFVMVGEEFEPAVFQLCAETQQGLNEARELINSFIIKEQTSSSVRDSAINNFTREDAEMLTNLQRELTVSIQLNKNGPEPVITVEGLTRDVVKAESAIRDMIRKVEKNEARKREAFMISSLVEWQYLDRTNNLVPFDIYTNYDLEEAYGKKQPRIKIKVNNEEVEVDLTQRVAYLRNRRIELKRVDRKDQPSVALPSHWDKMKDGEFVKRVQIQQGSQEYKDVENEFRTTGLANKILNIERVQNSTLWRNYMIQKKHFEEKNKHKNNEKRLFHGTGAQNIDKIDHRGFNRSYAGTHGAMYGNGVYFAVDPSYSAQGYSQPDQQGHKRMYLARVLVGDYTTGKGGLISPPAKSSTATDLYDSVTDNQQTPKMFVIFHDVQAYPEYLITFQ